MLRDIFKKYEDEFHEFDRVEHKLSQRPDLHTFLLLDRLLPSKHDIVTAAEHDEIWLGVDECELGKVATEAQIRELIHCGVRWDSETDSLAMFV